MLPCVVLASSLPARGALPKALRMPVRGVGSGLESMEKGTVLRLVIPAIAYLCMMLTISLYPTGIKDLLSMKRWRRRRGDIAGWLDRWPVDCPRRGSVLLGCGRECVRHVHRWRNVTVTSLVLLTAQGPGRENECSVRRWATRDRPGQSSHANGRSRSRWPKSLPVAFRRQTAQPTGG